jgi:NOL1/NOP2/fmu family ribosome biogenesis protein
MKRIDILNNRQVREIDTMIGEQWGGSLPTDLAILRSGTDRFSVVTKEALSIDDKALRIDSIGLYFGTLEKGELRLSIEGSQIVGKTAQHHIIDIDDVGMMAWLRGTDLPTESVEKGFLLVRHGHDFLGCGKVKDGKLLNFYPKSRRITTSSGNST